MMNIDLSILSKYRTELMGVATLMIIICHIPAQEVLMPSWIARIIGSAGTGCDVFLFLSGMGMWNSMNAVREKRISIMQWYWKRYIRIIIPYILIVVPVCVFLHRDGIIEVLVRATGFDFFVYELALWYVSCTLVLYLLTPFIDKPLNSKRKCIWTIVLILFSLAFAYVKFGDSYVISNWQFVVGRFPSFFIGYSIAPLIRQKAKISVHWLLTVPVILYVVFYVLNHKFECNFNLFWLQGIPIMTIAAIIISRLKTKGVNTMLVFLGTLSLESYSTNVLILPNFKSWGWVVYGFDINPGNWTFYIVGTMICLSISIIINRISKRIISLL